ncbi:MAG: MlaE family ABC transporter permease [Solirubrobacteraceae bacterium]
MSAIGGEQQEEAERAALIERLTTLPGPDVLVSSLRNLGEVGGLAIDVLKGFLRNRGGLGREFLAQCAFITRVVLNPVMAVNGIFALSVLGLSVGIALDQLGALDRSGAFAGPGLIREFGVFMTGSVFAGVIGTTYAAEFGARKSREELEALAVLGVDVTAKMIVPRAAAMIVMSVVVFLIGFVAGCVGLYIAVVGLFHSPSGPFLPQLLANTSFVDLWAAIVKVAIFGFVITVIACQKGLAAEGGPEGVGRAVNESVVACLVAVFFVNILYTQFLLALVPDLASFR